MADKKPSAAQREDESAVKPFVFSASSNYGSWSADKEKNDGDQLVTFLQMGYDAKTWGLAVTGRAAQSSYQTNSSEERFDVSTLTDTELSDFVAYTTGSWMLRTGVDVTLPTGKHGYANNELLAIMSDTLSSDLMAITSYGQGLNFSPHLVLANKVSPSMTVGLGLKYSFTGEYDATTEIEDDSINPGDRLTALVNTALMLSATDYVMATGAYSTAGRDTRQGVDIFRQGDILSLDLKYIHKWFDGLTSVFNVSYMTQQKNDLINESLVIQNETQNSNNNSVQVAINSAWTLSKGLALTGMVGYKQVDANGYPEDNPLYDGGRWKAFLEPGVIAYFSDSFYATLKGRYTTLYNKKDALASEDIRYDVYNLDLAVVYNFGL
ncbi:MAG: hypothetical protein HQK86_14410 [Nitrospinae bacterium]|nr:hypothetical protein [Nitrospinota bacterium]